MIALLIVATAGSVTANDNEAANKLFVDAVQMLKKAEAAQPSEAVKLYEEVLKRLDAIVEDFPGSNVAVQLATGQSIGEISRVKIEEALVNKRHAMCTQSPTASCVLAEAEAVVQHAHEDWERWLGAAWLARGQAKAGRLSDALTTARSLAGMYQVFALAYIAEVEAQEGRENEARLRIGEALSTTKGIEAALERAHAWILIAYGHANLGEVAQAQENIAEARLLIVNLNDREREDALCGIAAVQAELGHFDEALGTARSIKDSRTRECALCEIVEAAADSGDTATARNITHTITIPYMKAWALAEIAQAEVRRGHVGGRSTIDEAIKSAPRPRNERNDETAGIDWAWATIAEAQAEAGEFTASLESSRTIEFKDYRAWALGSIAGALAKSDHP
jgi:tetratricopeptide (TPR) repeat protein